MDGLFVNAGITRRMLLESMTEEAYDEQFDVNVKGSYFTVQKLVPLLRPDAGIVLTTSAANVIGMPTVSAYAAGRRRPRRTRIDEDSSTSLTRHPPDLNTPHSTPVRGKPQQSEDGSLR